MHMIHARMQPARDLATPPVEVADEDLVVRVATWFYLEGRTQRDIARELAIDPSTVSRYLKRAREEGIIRVEIRRPRRLQTDLGRELSVRYGLRRALVVPGYDVSTSDLGVAAAGYVLGLLRNGLRLGVSWGRTLAALVYNLQPGVVSDLDIAQLAGGLSATTPGVQGHELARHLGAIYPGSRVQYLHAPVIVDSAEIRGALVGHRSIRAALTAAVRSELALVGIGSMDTEATMIVGGHMSAVDYRRLVRHGAVASLNTRFFDRHGQPVPDLEKRTIAIESRELAGIQTVVAVAGGEPKWRAIAAALQIGCIHVLVTDEATARFLLAAAGD